MIDKIEITIVKDGVRHILQPEVTNSKNSENYAESIASMICEIIDMCAINKEYIANRIKEQARWEKE